jgi:hypothetical protein
LQSFDLGANGIDSTHDFMARDDRYPGRIKLTVNNVKVRSADAAGKNLDSDLTPLWRTIRKFRPFERLSYLFQ